MKEKKFSLRKEMKIMICLCNMKSSRSIVTALGIKSGELWCNFAAEIKFSHSLAPQLTQFELNKFSHRCCCRMQIACCLRVNAIKLAARAPALVDAPNWIYWEWGTDALNMLQNWDCNWFKSWWCKQNNEWEDDIVAGIILSCTISEIDCSTQKPQSTYINLGRRQRSTKIDSPDPSTGAAPSSPAFSLY